MQNSGCNGLTRKVVMESTQTTGATMTTPTQTKLQTLKSATRTMLIEDDHFQSVMASAYQWDGLRLAGLDPEKTQAAKDALRAVVNAAASALHAEFTDSELAAISEHFAANYSLQAS
jgi:hypothetical protein